MREGKYKKVLIAFGLVALLFSASAALAFGGYKNAKYERNERRGMMVSNYGNDNFAIPSDALKIGEIVGIADDVDDIKSKAEEIALQQEGAIYETNISYLANEIRNANIVLQVPAEKFEKTLESIRSLGINIVRESTRQIPSVPTYPEGVGTKESIKAEESQDAKVETEQTEVKNTDEGSQSSPEGEQAIEPQKEIYQQPQIKVQDKAYVRLVLTDYDNIGGFSKIEKRSGMMFFQNDSQQFSKAMWIAIGIKAALLLAMFCLLIFLSIRMIASFHRYRIHKKNTDTKASAKKAVVHVIRKSPKSRVVKRKI